MIKVLTCGQSFIGEARQVVGLTTIDSWANNGNVGGG